MPRQAKVIGVLCQVDMDKPTSHYALLNPDVCYAVLEPEQTPDTWLPVVAQLQKVKGTVPIGVIVDAGSAK